MATDSAKLQKYSAMAAGPETSTGVALTTLDATNGKFVIIDPSLTFSPAFNKVPLPGSPGQRKGSAGAKMGTLTFKTEVTGNGATGLPPWASVLLPACDWETASSTFAAARGLTTLTMEWFEDGIKRRLFGARGNWNVTCETGKPAVIEWTFTGKYDVPVDQSLITPTYPTVLAPIFAAVGSVSIGSFSPRLSQITFGPGNEVVMREDPNDVTGYHAAAIPDRDPQGSMDPEAVAVATQDWYGAFTAGTEYVMTVTLGATANNTVVFAAPSVQIVNPGRGSRNKLLTDALGFQLNGASPMSIAFS